MPQGTLYTTRRLPTAIHSLQYWYLGIFLEKSAYTSIQGVSRVCLHSTVGYPGYQYQESMYTQQQVCRCILCLIPITLYTYTTYMHLYPTPWYYRRMESHTPVYQEGRVGYWYQQQGRLVPQDTMVPIGTYTLEVNTQGNYLYLPSWYTLQYLLVPKYHNYLSMEYTLQTGKGTPLGWEGAGAPRVQILGYSRYGSVCKGLYLQYKDPCTLVPCTSYTLHSLRKPPQYPYPQGQYSIVGSSGIVGYSSGSRVQLVWQVMRCPPRCRYTIHTVLSA